MIPKTTLARWRANPIGFIQQVLINPETKKPLRAAGSRTRLPHACVRHRA